jgi:hypothetical protein
MCTLRKVLKINGNRISLEVQNKQSILHILKQIKIKYSSKSEIDGNKVQLYV